MFGNFFDPYQKWPLDFGRDMTEGCILKNCHFDLGIDNNQEKCPLSNETCLEF